MIRIPLSLFTLAALTPSVSAQTLLSAADVLDSFPSTIPMADARGVVVIPTANDATGTGGRSRRGVLFVKEDGGWGEPAYVILGGDVRYASNSAPTDLVLVFRSRRSLDRAVNGDGRIDAEVTSFSRSAKQPFASVSLEGATLRRGSIFRFAGERKHARALRTKLTELTAPKPAAEVKAPAGRGLALALEHWDAAFGGLAAVGAWLTAVRKRRR